MALTMTRTRTQTTLTKLAETVANLHGELAALDRLMKEWPEYSDALVTRRQRLEADRGALHLTIRQFDPNLDPSAIGTSDKWLTAYGRRGSRIALIRYLDSLMEGVTD